MPKSKPKPPGRPTKYRPEYAEQARSLCLLGATDEDLAAAFRVSVRSISGWKTQYPEFLQALKEGKSVADAQVADSLYRLAIGGHATTETREVTDPDGSITRTVTRSEIPPSPTACIFWLKNRQPKHWRDRVEVDATVTAPVNLAELSAFFESAVQKAAADRERIRAERKAMGLLPIPEATQ